MRLKTRWSDWEADGPGPYTFRAVMSTLVNGLSQAGMIEGTLDRATWDELMQACYLAVTDRDAFWATIPETYRDRRTPHERDLDKEINRAFHRLWTKAVGQEGYDKEEWKRLEGLMWTLGWER